MPRVRWLEISGGNILTIIAMAGSLVVFTGQVTSAVESIRKDFEKKDLEHDLKIKSLEVSQAGQVVDHDRIVSMEADIKFIRQTLEARSR